MARRTEPVDRVDSRGQALCPVDRGLEGFVYPWWTERTDFQHRGSLRGLQNSFFLPSCFTVKHLDGKKNSSGPYMEGYPKTLSFLSFAPKLLSHIRFHGTEPLSIAVHSVHQVRASHGLKAEAPAPYGAAGAHSRRFGPVSRRRTRRQPRAIATPPPGSAGPRQAGLRPA